ARSSPKITTPTLSASRLRAKPRMPPGNSTISPAWTLSRPWTRATPSPTESTWPTSATSASVPKSAICCFRMAEISAARISLNSNPLHRKLQARELALERCVDHARADFYDEPADQARIYPEIDRDFAADRLAE